MSRRHYLSRILLVIALSVFCITSSGRATIYYVDATNGKDSNKGTSEAASWKTIAKVNRSKFRPGDRILFKRGEIWRETLVIPSSGNASASIIFGSYGTGNRPTITGADLISGWSLYMVNTFKALTSPVQPNQVFMDYSVRLTKGTSPEALNNKEWFWNNGTLFLRYEEGNPDQAGRIIEASQRSNCILLDYPEVKNFIVIDSFSIEKANSFNIFIGSALNGFIVKDSVTQFSYYDGIKISGGTKQSNGLIEANSLAFNGKSGINVTGSADSWVIRGNKSFDNCQVDTAEHDFCAGIYIWGNDSKIPNRITNIVIESNESYLNGIIRPTSNRGAGIWLDDCGKGNIIRYNSVYKNNSNGIFLEATSDSQVYYNVVHSNNGTNEWVGGIHIKGNDGRKASSNLMANNTIYNNWAGIAVDTFGSNSLVVNNVIINNISAGNIKNLLAVGGGANDGGNGSGNIYQHNCFGLERNGFIRWGKNDYSSYNQWESTYGTIAYSIKADPQFANSVSADFRLLSTSKCIRAGEDIGLVRDFEGNSLPVRQSPDIGALQYVGANLRAPSQLRTILH